MHYFKIDVSSETGFFPLFVSTSLPQFENLQVQQNELHVTVVHLMEICHLTAQLPVPSTRLSPQIFDSRCRKSILCSSSFSRLPSEIKNQKLQRLDHMFIFGIGFVGQYFADQLKKDGWRVSGTCTSATKKKNLEEMGFEAFLFGGSGLEFRGLSTLQDATHLLISIPPIGGHGDPVLSLHQDILQNKLSNGNLQWLCYLSTTSVYGDCGGALVDEDYPISATSESAKARLAAEKGWLDVGHNLGVTTHVFRLGGLYGPGRSALDTMIKQKCLSQEQRMRESRHYTSRIHVADICQALNASIDMASPSRIYNIVDDDPAPRAEVFAFARDLIEKKWPGKVEYNSSSRAAVFQKNGTCEKRVSNARLKQELGVSLIYPTYRSGLQSIAELMHDPFQQA